MADPAPTTAAKETKKPDPVKMPIADIVEWLVHVTKLGGGLSGEDTQRLIAASKLYGGTPTPRAPVIETHTKAPLPPSGPPTVPPGEPEPTKHDLPLGDAKASK